MPRSAAIEHTNPADLYTPAFYQSIGDGSARSAEIVVPMVMSLVSPRSVVDVGCGIGTWLAEFSRRGVKRLAGLDGAYVDHAQLRVKPTDFHAADLSEPIPESLKAGLGGRFDLAVSLEVAEHLPPDHSEAFVEDLASLSDIILFSAAVPFLGGVGHTNERWPTFWYELFRARGYELIDPLRKHIWSDRRVDPCYQQGLLIYARPDAIRTRAKLAREYAETMPGFLSMIHPRLYACLLERVGLKQPGPWPVPNGTPVDVPAMMKVRRAG